MARINARLRSVSLGNFGDAKAIGGGLSELCIHHEPGYRLYLLSGSDLEVEYA